MSETSLDRQCKLARHPDLLAVPMDGDLVMMSISQGSYYGINPVGVQIWQALESPQSLATLCELVTAEFDVSAAQCEQDMQVFIRQMLNAKVLELA
ncbi:MAG: PqqD family peptide modification chaperone [Undibacterium sp.]|uniref:PqqD family peptide modification chaperone n=1 Tax=Undibacterium sp. TaxID=1914977 RepID=UPI0027217A59|nr:PqqD family peptide modification chaperone [Undibacterium sp.]MDO8652619.1 PqqD family peptide modification chaperone [Undibacterium sp.]